MKHVSEALVQQRAAASVIVNRRRAAEMKTKNARQSFDDLKLAVRRCQSAQR